MSKEDIKQVLKPLIQECIREAITQDGVLENIIKESMFESGVLSSLIREVAHGLGSQPIIETVESQPQQEVGFDFTRQQRMALQEEALRSLEERKRQLESSLGAGFEGIFENVSPISQAGSPNVEGRPSSPLSGYAAGDAGVDISGLMALAGGNNWKKMI
jgi:hypothetical protein